MEIFIFCVVNYFLCGVFDTDIFVLVSAKLNWHRFWEIENEGTNTKSVMRKKKMRKKQ